YAAGNALLTLVEQAVTERIDETGHREPSKLGAEPLPKGENRAGHEQYDDHHSDGEAQRGGLVGGKAAWGDSHPNGEPGGAPNERAKQIGGDNLGPGGKFHDESKARSIIPVGGLANGQPQWPATAFAGWRESRVSKIIGPAAQLGRGCGCRIPLPFKGCGFFRRVFSPGPVNRVALAPIVKEE